MAHLFKRLVGINLEIIPWLNCNYFSLIIFNVENFTNKNVRVKRRGRINLINRDLKIEDGNVKGRLHVRVESGSRTASFRAGKIN